MRGAAVGGLVHLCEQGFTPLLRGGDRCLGESEKRRCNVYAAFTQLISSKLVSSTFFTRGPESLIGSDRRRRRARRW